MAAERCGVPTSAANDEGLQTPSSEPLILAYLWEEIAGETQEAHE